MSATANVSGQVDAAEIEKFDPIAHRFWDPRGEFKPLHVLNPARLQFIAAQAKLHGAQVADVGCGGGLLAEELVRAGAQVTGIDMSPAMIEVATLHALESALTVDYRMQSAESLAAQSPQAFSVVTCMELLEHVPDPAAMMLTLSALATPGGHVFVSTLNRNLRSFLGGIVAAEYVFGLLPRGTHEYARFIKPSELARAARAANLELIAMTGLAYNPLTDQAQLSRDVSINYIAHFRRAGT